MAEKNGVCRSGCKTQDHKSYGDCLRDSNVAIRIPK